MFKFNLTSIILLLSTTLLFVLLIREKDKVNAVKKDYSKKQADFTLYENRLYEEFRKQKQVIRDSVEYYKKLVQINKDKASTIRKRIKQLEADYSDFLARVDKIPYDSSYAFINNLYEATDGLDYSLSGNQIRSVHQDLVKGIKCEDIRLEQNYEIYYLDESLRASGEMNFQQELENEKLDSMLTKSIEDYREISLEKIASEEKLTKKLKRTRIITGVITVMAVIAWI